MEKPDLKLSLHLKHGYFNIAIALVVFFMIGASPIYAGPYINSAHGNSVYGANRSSLSVFGYSRGNCAHCHEQHASIGGSEPAPISGIADKSLLFNKYVDQDTGFCFGCHQGAGSYQSPLFNNYNYSNRAGGASINCPDDILEAFSFIDESGNSVSNCGSTAGSSHKLTDIVNFISGKWGYTDYSSPCVACHNAHRATRDSHTSGNRGWPVSRPSDHNNSAGRQLWGDDLTEKMNIYTAGYQAPYRYNSTATYEPDGSLIQDGSNLTDYVTFCTDCHNSSNTIFSTTLGRNLRTIDWNNEKHGKGNADGSICVENPYFSMGAVLSCLDCHEPHGSENAGLIRQEVNGEELDGNIAVISSSGCLDGTDHNKEIAYLCDKCHKNDQEINPGCQENHWYTIHHDNAGCNTDRPYSPMSCSSCHGMGGGGGMDCSSDQEAINCSCCHYHGSFRSDCDSSPAGRRTF